MASPPRAELLRFNPLPCLVSPGSAEATAPGFPETPRPFPYGDRPRLTGPENMADGAYSFLTLEFTWYCKSVISLYKISGLNGELSKGNLLLLSWSQWKWTSKKKKKNHLENVLALFYRGGPSHDRKLISESHKHDQGEFCGCCLVAQLCLTLFQPHGL